MSVFWISLICIILVILVTVAQNNAKSSQATVQQQDDATSLALQPSKTTVPLPTSLPTTPVTTPPTPIPPPTVTTVPPTVVQPVEGNDYKCADDPSRYVVRYTGGQLNSYPSNATRLSWMPQSIQKYQNPPFINCKNYKTGTRMNMNPDLIEGASYYCQGMDKTIYTYRGTELKAYPNPTIAKSWNPYYNAQVQTVDCSTRKIGLPMTMSVR
jgi:hypothetical protein